MTKLDRQEKMNRLMENRKLGKRLRDRRIAKGIKASWVADQLGIGGSRLHYLESGELPWADWLRKAYLKAIGEQP